MRKAQKMKKRKKEKRKKKRKGGKVEEKTRSSSVDIDGKLFDRRAIALFDGKRTVVSSGRTETKRKAIRTYHQVHISESIIFKHKSIRCQLLSRTFNDIT